VTRCPRFVHPYIYIYIYIYVLYTSLKIESPSSFSPSVVASHSQLRISTPHDSNCREQFITMKTSRHTVPVIWLGQQPRTLPMKVASVAAVLTVASCIATRSQLHDVHIQWNRSFMVFCKINMDKGTLFEENTVTSRTIQNYLLKLQRDLIFF